VLTTKTTTTTTKMTTVTDKKQEIMDAVKEMLDTCKYRYDDDRDSFEEECLVEMTQEMATLLAPLAGRVMSLIEQTLMEQDDKWAVDTTVEIQEKGLYLYIEGMRKYYTQYMFEDIEGMLKDAFQGEDSEE
jgi:predicted transcriptional regulator